MKSAQLELVDAALAARLAGTQNENLRLVEQRLGVRIGQRGDLLHVSGPDDAVDLAVQLVNELTAMLESGRAVYLDDVEQALKVLSHSGAQVLRMLYLDPVLKKAAGGSIVPKGAGQMAYVEALRKDDIVFGMGPAGTGKTYLAVAMAVAALKEKRVKRIVLARPAVEAGEKLGFLPGDLAQKVDPYLRPLYDALHDMMEADKVASLIEDGVIEIAPLAFMRGRTLNDAYAILDEAQNTTVEQMKMFLTRLGTRSRAVVTGDPTQVDLPAGRESGLAHARTVLGGVEGIGFVQLTDVDVVRHPLVQAIVRAYARVEKPR